MNTETHLVTVWSGATWRTYDPPVTPPSPSAEPAPPRAVPAGHRQHQIRTVLTDEWRSIESLHAATGGQPSDQDRTSMGLLRLYRRGQVERLAEKVGHNGRPRWLYRRRQS